MNPQSFHPRSITAAKLQEFMPALSVGKIRDLEEAVREKWPQLCEILGIDASAPPVLTEEDPDHSRKNHHLPAHPPESSSSGQRRSNTQPSIPPGSPLRSVHGSVGNHSPGIAKGRRALGRTLAVLSRPEVQQAIRPFWQIDDMLLQLGRLERLRTELPEDSLALGAGLRPPVPQVPDGSSAPNLHTAPESIPSTDFTTR